MKDLKFETIELSKLLPYKNNPRLHSEDQIQKIAESIKEFGFLSPILIDKDNGIIAGHGRYKAALILGWKEVPCVRAEHLSDAQRRAYVIADNRLAELSTWDNDLLKIEIEDLKLSIDEFELEKLDVIGFNENHFLNNNVQSNFISKGRIINEYLLIIELENETQQQDLFESLKNQGYAVKIA
jgi:hypothetical protein